MSRERFLRQGKLFACRSLEPAMSDKGSAMNFSRPTYLGKTGLEVGRLGLGAGYGAPATAFEEAFERGCNYFYWVSRKPGMREAIKNICRQGKRDRLVIAVQSYSRSAVLMEALFQKALKSLSLDYVDVFILGWRNRPPPERLIDRALRMKEQGYFRFLGLSGHNRSLFPALIPKAVFDIFHIRYNAAHRGAEKETFPHLPAEGAPGIVSYTATRWGHLLDPKKIPAGEIPPSASDCYRFVLSHPAVNLCLCGPKDLQQMREALLTLKSGPLEAEGMERMRRIGDFIRAKKSLF